MIDLAEMFHDMAEKCMAQGAHIEFKAEPGEEGEHTIRMKGSGPMIFSGVCAILKTAAEAEAEQYRGDPKFKESYVKFVCDQVLGEIEEESQI